jgi:hypothetical protein
LSQIHIWTPPKPTYDIQYHFLSAQQSALVPNRVRQRTAVCHKSVIEYKSDKKKLVWYIFKNKRSN